MENDRFKYAYSDAARTIFSFCYAVAHLRLLEILRYQAKIVPLSVVLVVFLMSADGARRLLFCAIRINEIDSRQLHSQNSTKHFFTIGTINISHTL